MSHYIQYMSNSIGFRVGSETVVASKNYRNHSEMQKVNAQVRIWPGYESQNFCALRNEIMTFLMTAVSGVLTYNCLNTTPGLYVNTGSER